MAKLKCSFTVDEVFPVDTLIINLFYVCDILHLSIKSFHGLLFPELNSLILSYYKPYVFLDLYLANVLTMTIQKIKFHCVRF